MTDIKIIDCGVKDYQSVLLMQENAFQNLLAGTGEDTIFIVEHPSVITLGARESANKLLKDSDAIKQSGIEIFKIRRGGGTTAHNPGQLVVYPIIHLKKRNLGVSDFVHKLEDIGIELLKELGVNCQTKKGFPGLWIEDRKIVSIGVQIKKWITFHGIAININNDLSIFDLIVPCGLDNVKMTNAQIELRLRQSYGGQVGKKINIDNAKDNLKKILLKNFQFKKRLPEWLKRPLPAGENYNNTSLIIEKLGLETICTNANCPNKGECWSRGTATVLILGNICTRNCKFCSVAKGTPLPPDKQEPQKIAQLEKQLKLKYLVITSVTRDDLPDGGAAQFRDVINAVRQENKNIKIELLVPDFKNCQKNALEILSDALPPASRQPGCNGFVFGHNIETVPRLYKTARSGADYQTSLNLLETAKKLWPDTPTKSSIMLGLGETDDEIEHTLADLRGVDCDRIAIGQYLKPSKESLDVVEYIHPEKFGFWADYAKQLGFKWVMSSPFTRSSYYAEV
ncbi:MAG: lipoyl synthase [Sedimentisphaerales bacterium]|jgi:lipoic acid synthetase